MVPGQQAAFEEAARHVAVEFPPPTHPPAEQHWRPSALTKYSEPGIQLL